MNLGKNAALIGGAIFVIAASIFIETLETDPVPVAVSNTLELKLALFMCRTLPPPGSQGTDKADENSDLLETGAMIKGLLADLAGRPFNTPSDHLTAAAVAAAVDARYLVPLFVGGLAVNDRGADVMVRWALDPGFRPGLADLTDLRRLQIDKWAVDMVVSSVMRPIIPNLPEQHSRLARWTRLTWLSGALMASMFGLLVWGLVSWFGWRRRQLAEAARGRDPAVFAESPLAGLFAAYIWFTAYFLAVNLLVPEWLNKLGLSLPVQAVFTYVVTGIGGFAIVGHFGRSDSETDWRRVLGFGSPMPEPPAPWRPVSPMPAGLRGYAMIWPILLVATFIENLMGGAANGLDNPVALFLATEPDVFERALLVLSAGLLAPVFEEPIFRGFFYRRFRRILSPYGAAAASGFIFAAAHFSNSGFLSLWAIGFTLGLTYESSGKLRSSMLAHALWNMGTAAGILALYS